MALIKICVMLAFATVVYCSPTSKGSSLDTFQLSDFLEVKQNDYQSDVVTGRSENTLDGVITDYIKSHDATFNLPIIGSITISGRSLSDDEEDLELDFSDSGDVEGRRKKFKKHKLRKIFVPIFIILLLKVITLIPLAIGVLGLKTWNALQLSFITFVISISMAVWQLCKKVAADSHPPIVAHGPWDVHRRSFGNEDAQKIAYSAYTQ